MSVASSTAVSAPGKVLLTGGYLVLDQEYTGLVFGLDARIHVLVKPLSTESGDVRQEIVVRSPQFKSAVWEYGYRLQKEVWAVEVSQLKRSSEAISPNPFVEATLRYALSYLYVKGAAIFPASVTILASDAYYTAPSAQEGASTSPFTNFGIPLSAAHKTGLGSSAALVTALTAGLLAHFAPDRSLGKQSWLDRLHRLAQAAHSAAQGKLGSGFDVAAAVYGSCHYRRFSPALLGPVTHAAESADQLAVEGRESAVFSRCLARLVNGEDSPGVMKWDAQVDGGNARLPPGLRLVLADVDAGSATPGMARGVLSWRAGNPALAKDLWSRLGSANGAVAAELSRLCSQAAASNAGGARFDALAARIADVRALLREMSTATGVPVEPPAQTALLDDLSRVEGVVGGVVPGAGGFDAVVLLVEEDEAHPGVTERVGAAVAAWNSKSDRPTGAGRVSLLPVRQDDRGVVFENAARYDGWITEMDG